MYSDFLMGSIAYIRMMVGLSLRIMYEEVEGMFLLMGMSPISSHVTIPRRTCTQAATIDGKGITVETADGKTHRPVADSTGIAATNKGRWIKIKWNVKCRFIKLHILMEQDTQKILAFPHHRRERG